MISDQSVRPTKWARAKSNEDLLSIDSRSGYRGTVGDPLGVQHDLLPTADDETLGAAVLDCLSKSRFLDSPELRAELFRLSAVQLAYEAWVDRLTKFGGYKTRRALFKDMMSVSIECEDDTITFAPSHHEKLEAWSGKGISPSDHVVISASEPPTAIGAALRESLRRCT